MGADTITKPPEGFVLDEPGPGVPGPPEGFVLDEPGPVKQEQPTGVLTTPFPVKRERRQGAWGINQQLDGLFSGRTDMTDLLPLDVGYKFGQVVGMMDSPEDVESRMSNSTMYSVMFDMPQKIAFDNLNTLNKQVFDKELSPTAAWRLCGR